MRLFLFALSAATVFGQLPAPNEAGVSTGHLHLMVKDPEAQKKVWIEVMGATEVSAGTLKLLKLNVSTARKPDTVAPGVPFGVIVTVMSPP